MSESPFYRKRICDDFSLLHMPGRKIILTSESNHSCTRLLFIIQDMPQFMPYPTYHHLIRDLLNWNIHINQLKVLADIDAVTPVFPVSDKCAKHRLCLHHRTAYV